MSLELIVELNKSKEISSDGGYYRIYNTFVTLQQTKDSIPDYSLKLPRKAKLPCIIKGNFNQILNRDEKYIDLGFEKPLTPEYYENFLKVFDGLAGIVYEKKSQDSLSWYRMSVCDSDVKIIIKS